MAGRASWALPVVLVLAALLFPAGAQAQLWYDLNEPYASATGPDVRVFDWSEDRCGIKDDIPDQPARAFRDFNEQVNLIASHHAARRKLGNTLATVVHQCAPVMTSTYDSNVSHWDYYKWLSSPYTRDGRNVYSLSHMEYQGWKFEPGGYCVEPGEDWPSQQKCWYNMIVLVSSADGGATFSNSAPPTHYLAGPAYRYAPGIGPIGFFSPSNIVRGKDGYYYTIVHVQPYGAQPKGACLWRTQDLSDPKSWRAWSGSGFTVRFLDPYVNDITDPAQHACAPVGSQTIQTGSETLTWSTYFKKWLLVRAGGGGSDPWGFYTYTSDDLINWSQGTLMALAEFPWTHTCGEPDYIMYPSLLDPESQSRNFETTGQRPYLFFTHFNVAYDNGTCWMDWDRDLIRVPIEFSNQQPGGPAASLAASTASPRTGESVTFDASGSRDADGSIVKHEWDLDGDGTYERDTGSNPVTQRAYDAPGSVTATVRVSDDDGKATDDTRIVRVTGSAPGPSAGDAPGAGSG
ncbi:MAG: PKD domain-containing protein, partial [Solirubrobacterales bacterium]